MTDRKVKPDEAREWPFPLYLRCPKCGSIELQYNGSALAPAYDNFCDRCNYAWTESLHRAVEIHNYIITHGEHKR